MPTNVGSVVASIVPDVSDFASRADAALTPSVERLGRSLGQTLSQSITRSFDFSGIESALRRSLDVAEASAVSKGREIGRRYGQAMRAGLDSELRGLNGTLDVTIRPVIDRSAYRAVMADLDVLTRTRTVVIHTDVNTRTGADDLALLTRARTVTINANADTAAAAAQLALLARNRTATINANINSSQVARASSLISRITGIASSAGGAIGGVASKVALLGAGAPVVGSLVNVLAAIAPAAALAVPAVATLGSVFGALKLGTSGLGDAFKEAFGTGASAASGAASGTRQVEQAQRQLADAQRGVGDAQRQAAEQVAQAQEAVANAQKDLTAAQKDAKQAQQDLTQAYEDGRRALQDMNLQLSGSKLDEKEAILRVKEAQEDLDKTLANPKASQLDREEAQLRLDEAKQGLKEQQVETQRLEEDTKKANKAGVEGTQQVKSAKDRLAQANQDVADKTKGVKDAESAVAKAQADGARQVADAQRAVADASRSLADAQTASAAQTAKLSENFSKLSPNAQGFVSAVKGLKPAWDGMQLGVQDRLFAGIGGRLTDVGRRVIPIVRGGLEGTAGVLNTVGKNALTAVDNLARTGTLKKVFDGATSSLRPLSRIPGQLVTGFGQVAVAAQPAFQRVTTAAGGVVDHLAAKLSGAFSSGGLEKAINTAVDLIGDLGDVGKNVLSTLGSVFEAGADTGGGTIGMLKTITAEIAKIASSPEVQGGLKALFGVMGTLASTAAPLLGKALMGVGIVFAHLGPPVQELIRGLGVALPGVLTKVQPLLSPLADAGRQIWRSLKPLAPLLLDIGSYVLKDLVGGLSAVTPVAADLISTALVPITGFIGFVDRHKVVFGSVATGILAIVLAIKLWQLWQKLVIITTTAWTVVQAAFNAVLSANPIALVILAIAGLAAGIIYAYKHSETFRRIVNGAWTAIKDTALGVVHWFTGSFIPFFTKTIPGTFSTTVQWVKDHWPLILSIITGPIGAATIYVVRHWDQIRGGISDAWTAIKSHTLTPMKTFFTDTIPGWAKSFKDGVVGFFKSAVSGIDTAWSKLQDVAKHPVKFLIQTVFNDGLRKVWNNTAAKLPGIKTIPEMAVPKGFASGGILPGYTPGTDVHRFFSPTGGRLDLSGGESIMRPEVTRAVGRGGINALNAAARSGGVAGVQALLGNGLPHRAFWGGGIWDDLTDNPVTNSLKSVVGDGIDLLKKGADWARGGVADLAEKTLKKLLGVTSLTVDTKNQIWSKLVGNVPVVLAAKIVDLIRGKEDSGAGSSASIKGYKPSAGVAQWAGVVLQALKEVGQPASLKNDTLRRMQQESGGNPTIVNKWDSNWIAGHPSVGLMQVIGPTFKAYAGKYRTKGPFLYGTSVDPLANVYSSMKYALSAYGSLSRAYNRAGGYAKGGTPSVGEWAWVGEEGPELLRFKRPAQVYPHQESMRIAQQMAVTGQGLPSPADRDERGQPQVTFLANVTDKPTRQTVMDAMRDFTALHGPLVIA